MESPSSSEHLPSTADVQRGTAIIDYVSAGLGAISGGLSEAVMLPLRRLMDKRVQEMENAIVADLRDGRLSEDDVIEEELSPPSYCAYGGPHLRALARKNCG